MTRIRCLLIGTVCALTAGCTLVPHSPFASFAPMMAGSELPATSATAPAAEPEVGMDIDMDTLCWPEATEIAEYELSATVDLWDRIRAGFALPDQDHQRIQQELQWYAKHPSYMARVAERGAPYLHHIVEELEARNMPLEFALLPIVESAFDPFAYSHGRASGMWQFVPDTGKALGLKQNWWYDGRRDVVASTDAALRYLDRLAKAFDDDWLLALASYNGGRGNVARAIRRNKALGKPTDYWSLDLPRETEAYVPRLLALKALVANPAQFDLSLKPIPNTPVFGLVDVGSQIDLAQAAELAGMSMEDFYLLNPGFNRWATDPQGPHQLLVPLDKLADFESKLASIPADQRVTWDRYRIKAGDTLSTIAARYKTSVDGLKTVNGLRGNVIRRGDVLLVPVAAQDSSHYAFSADQRLKQAIAQTDKKQDGHKMAYEVQAGDSFWTISRRYDVTVRQLASWNGMAPGDPLQIGQELVLWSDSASGIDVASQGVVRKVAYRVRQGDSLYRIAQRFRVSIDDIQRWNQLKRSAYLQPGQALTLFVDVTRH